MKLRIWDGQPHKKDCVYLRLKVTDQDHVTVSVVGQDGEYLFSDDPDRGREGGAILTITRKGHIALSCAVLSDLGFDLDNEGRVKLDPKIERMTADRQRNSSASKPGLRII